MLHISNMHGTGISSTRTLNINRECDSMSAENLDVAESPDSAQSSIQSYKNCASQMSTT